MFATISYAAFKTAPTAAKIVGALPPGGMRAVTPGSGELTLHADTFPANVNWLIDTCSRLGQYSLTDPGPPPAIFSKKSTPANEQGPHPCGRQTPAASIKSDGPYSQSLLKRLLAKVESRYSPDMAGLQPASASITTPSSASSAIAGGPIRDPSLAAGLHPPAVIIAASRGSRDTGLSIGAKITIALSTAAVLFILASLVLVWYLRFRRQARRARLHGDSNSSSKDDHSRIGAHGSPMPLLSAAPRLTNPSDSPLRPPARLRDRRFLARGSNWPLSDMDEFPQGIVTGNEDMPTSPGVRKHRARPSSLKTGARSLRVATSRGTATTGTGTVRYGNVASPPQTPRTPRQQTSLDLFSIASPGPPPTRALPSTPTERSPSVSPSTRRQREGIGVAIGSWSQTPGGSRELLLELMEEPVQEAHRSWGTWSGRSGPGSVGMAPSSVVTSTRTRELNSPVMDEGELERLGGTYK
ncbi:hypothetical protein JDV02_006380 [Purpureocillium takamizusanense]|uniref:Uncharacterized protein n=1 Tax=Purpureocillium takamizusanense TaxID=2060973 RepID=A0A9Q8QK53_9HYPO|nr:uncharacterized protein JDV02_006380 [Purpureocillium takamizusanense]UNI20279.1 hypothetical protein JDV02_006380 [Purpureocillium takamizusanense]